MTTRGNRLGSTEFDVWIRNPRGKHYIIGCRSGDTLEQASARAAHIVRSYYIKQKWATTCDYYFSLENKKTKAYHDFHAYIKDGYGSKFQLSRLEK